MSFTINPNVDRVLEPPTNETREWVARRAYNPDLAAIDAAQAVPSYAPADALSEYLAEQVRIPDTAFYTPILGTSDLREALAESLSAQYEASIPASAIAITCGGNHAYCMAVQAVAGPGDEVILPEPFYFNHQMWFDLQGIGTRVLNCRETSDGIAPDPEEAKALITDRTRAIILVSPNNPTGTIYPPELLKRFYDLARENGLALMVDETYKDFLPANQAPHDLFKDPDWGETFVFLYSFSKVYSLTGYRVGAIAGGARFIDAVAKIADTLTICAPHVSQKAALFGLRHLGGWAAAKREDLARRLELLRSTFADVGSSFRLVSSGAFFGYVAHPYGGTASIEVSRRLFQEQSVLTWPGSFFGSNQESYIRLAFANAGDGEIVELVKRLAAAGPG